MRGLIASVIDLLLPECEDKSHQNTDRVAIMQSVQKISVSLDPAILGFIDRYAQDHATKGRSAVVARALQLLQLTEQESNLAEAYAQSASQDQQIAAEFEVALSDGLPQSLTAHDQQSKAANETW
jgi:Arc/MetJ-type ribon-helix-helix transcriptional regulator